MSSTESPSELADKCANFFLNKIEKIREQFHDQNTQRSYHRKCSSFTGFLPLNRDEMLNNTKNMNPTTCIMDPCNTKFLLRFKDTILDAITTMINQSLTNRRVPR